MMAVADDVHQRHRLFVELVASGFDPRQIENLVDEVEQVDARIVNVGRIFLVNRDRMTAEDFAYFSQEMPACFYRLGTGNPERGITSPIHTDTFDVDEAALETGMGLMAFSA